MNFNFQVNKKTSYSLLFPFIIGNFVKSKSISKNTLKCKEELPETEHPVSPFDSDDPDFEQLQQILNDPHIDPEMYKEIMMESKQIGIQPLKFNQLHAQIKKDLDDDVWTGLRLNLNWRPTNMFNSEFIYNIDGNPKPGKFRLSATTIVPGKISRFIKYLII